METVGKTVGAKPEAAPQTPGDSLPAVGRGGAHPAHPDLCGRLVVALSQKGRAERGGVAGAGDEDVRK